MGTWARTCPNGSFSFPPASTLPTSKSPPPWKLLVWPTHPSCSHLPAGSSSVAAFCGYFPLCCFLTSCDSRSLSQLEGHFLRNWDTTTNYLVVQLSTGVRSGRLYRMDKGCSWEDTWRPPLNCMRSHRGGSQPGKDGSAFLGQLSLGVTAPDEGKSELACSSQDMWWRFMLFGGFPWDEKTIGVGHIPWSHLSGILSSGSVEIWCYGLGTQF